MPVKNSMSVHERLSPLALCACTIPCGIFLHKFVTLQYKFVVTTIHVRHFSESFGSHG